MTAKSSPPPSPSARRWGWAILLMTATISLAFNIGHAIRAANGVPPVLAVLYGVAPVMVALMLSHLIAIQHGGIVKRIATGIVFVGAMALSVRAIYEVLEPLAERWGLLFAAMLDLASLLALNEVLASGPHDRHTATSASATAPINTASSTNAASAAPPPPNPGGLPLVRHSPTTAAASASLAAPKSTRASMSAPRRSTATATPRQTARAATTDQATAKGEGAATARPTPIGQPARRQTIASSSESPLAPTATSPEPPHAEPATPPTNATAHGSDGQDWRSHLATDVAAAAVSFVRQRDAAGEPRRGAGAEFARQAQDAGTNLSTRQLRAYVTDACRHLDEEHS